MRMGQGVRTGLGHGGITCVLQTQFSSLYFDLFFCCCFLWARGWSGELLCSWTGLVDHIAYRYD